MDHVADPDGLAGGGVDGLVLVDGVGLHGCRVFVCDGEPVSGRSRGVGAIDGGLFEGIYDGLAVNAGGETANRCRLLIRGAVDSNRDSLARDRGRLCAINRLHQLESYIGAFIVLIVGVIPLLGDGCGGGPESIGQGNMCRSAHGKRTVISRRHRDGEFVLSGVEPPSFRIRARSGLLHHIGIGAGLGEREGPEVD